MSTVFSFFRDSYLFHGYKLYRLDEALDKIRGKYGKNAINTGGIMASDIGLNGNRRED